MALSSVGVRKVGVRAAVMGFAVVLTAGIAGCGSDSDADAADSASSTPAPAAAGPNFGVCGSLTDDEVRTAFAVPAFAVITRNSVGCEWEVSGPTGPSVSFSWYRGSPIGRERAGSELIGRPADDIEIDGHTGFQAEEVNALGALYLCETALQFGADFIHFSVMYADSPPTADPCTVGTDLLNLVVARAQ